jgi:predicted ATP-grasp superfamily ATP-dependent carboligase
MKNIAKAIMNTSKKTVYILEAQSLTALTTARAMQRHYNCVGIYLEGCESFSSLLSNSWDELISIPDLGTATIAILKSIGKGYIEKYHEKPVLLTATDDGVIFLSEHQYELADYFVIPIPEKETVDILMDKSLFYRWAEQHQLPIIATKLCEDDSMLSEVIATFPLPFILKPKVRMHLWNTHFPQEKILTVTNEADRAKLLLERLGLLKGMGGIIVQKLIPGGDENIYFVLAAFNMDGNMSNLFGGQKLAQWPPKGGSTLVCVEHDNPSLLRLARELFDLLPMKGLASVEYKKCAETGVFYIIEPTVGRCDHQSLVAEYSKVNLVVEFLTIILGNDKSSIPFSLVKHKHRVWIDEICFVRLLRSDFKLALHVMGLIGYANVWKLRPLLFRFTDMKPFLRSLFNLLGIFRK